MKMKSFLILLLFLALINLNLLSQRQDPPPPPPLSQPDHLEPLNSIFSVYEFQFEYYSRVRKILFEKLSDSPEISFLVMPSFSPENIVIVEHDREIDKYFLIYHIGERMIWDNKNWEKTIVYEFKKEIDKESVQILRELFKTAISETKFATSEIMGLDGENYYFSYFENGVKTGTTWSPMEGTKLDRLVKIGFELINLAKNDDNPIILNNDLKIKIKNLIKEF